MPVFLDIERFCDATVAWAERTEAGALPRLIAQILAKIGGEAGNACADRPAPVATVPPGPPRADPVRRHAPAWYTVGRLRAWLETLARRVHMEPGFLCLALVRAVDDDLARAAGTAAAAIGDGLAHLEWLEAIAADPERTAAWLRDQREANARAGAPVPRELTAADVPAIVDRMRRDLVSSVAYRRAAGRRMRSPTGPGRPPAH